MNVGGGFDNGTWRCLTCGWMCQYVPDNPDDPKIPTCGQREEKYCAGRCQDMRMAEYVFVQPSHPQQAAALAAHSGNSAGYGGSSNVIQTGHLVSGGIPTGQLISGGARSDAEMRRQVQESMARATLHSDNTSWKLPTEDQLGGLSEEQLQSLHADLKQVMGQIERIQADKALCVICANALKNTILYPCKHQCVCYSCSEKVKECPVCRQGIVDRIKPFA